jgi:hypothetical protein
MKLLVHDIPESAEQLAPWLEQQLIGLDLRDLVAELSAFLGDQPNPKPLETVLAGQLERVMAGGLRGLPERSLRGLLQNPQRLLDLQDRVLREGSDYWNRVDQTDDHKAAVNDGWERLQTATGAGAPRAAVATPSGMPGWTRALGVLLAAGVLIAVTVFFQPASTRWGFERPGLLTASQPTPTYFRSLATAVEEDWTPQRTQTRDKLLTSLKEFRHACDTLLADPLAHLPEKDRTFLKDRCLKWRDRIDGHIADLEQNRKPVDDVRLDADATVKKLTTVLRDEAAKV